MHHGARKGMKNIKSAVTLKSIWCSSTRKEFKDILRGAIKRFNAENLIVCAS
jgi:hypothetical protein